MNAQSPEELYRRACLVMPGGVSSPVRAYKSVGGTPVFLQAGSGPLVFDVSGRRLVDMVGSWGPLILGHADPLVVLAVREAAGRGTSFGAPTEAEVELAELICDAMPSIEMVRFVSSGTEASMSSIRLARGATGRAKILKFEGCYHGHVDSLLVSAGSGPATLGISGSPGVTEGARADTVVCRYNSSTDAAEAFDRYGEDLAAVIVEPIAANMGVVPPSGGFLQHLRDLCDRAGALLIFDEVITGFRVAFSGAQGLLDVRPDLTILGKIIGGGMPVGAYGGRRDLMEQVAPSGPVYQAGTLSGNPVSMAAGLATLTRLAEDTQIYPQLEMAASRLQDGVMAHVTRTGVPVRVQRAGSLVTVFFSAAEVTDWAGARGCNTAQFAEFFQALLAQKVLWPPSQYEAAFVSAAHTSELIDEVVAAAGHAFDHID